MTLLKSFSAVWRHRPHLKYFVVKVRTSVWSTYRPRRPLGRDELGAELLGREAGRDELEPELLGREAGTEKLGPEVGRDDDREELGLGLLDVNGRGEGDGDQECDGLIGAESRRGDDG